jgi:hypothetical protein
MSTDARSARELTRSVTARAVGNIKPAQGDALAMLSTCDRAFGALSRSLGAPGFGTLLRRAKAVAERMHPLLSDLHVASHEPYLGGIPELVQQHGDPAVIEGLEAILETMLSVLGGLIGLDMVARLIENNPPVDSTLVEDTK